MTAYTLSHHAEQMLAERRIEAEWVGLAVQQPTRTEPDLNDPALEHRMRRIPAYGNRVLPRRRHPCRAAARRDGLFRPHAQERPDAMKLRVDREADALYLRLNDEPIECSEEAAPGIVLDYDAEGRVVGIEVLRLSERVPAAGLGEVEVRTG